MLSEPAPVVVGIDFGGTATRFVATSGGRVVASAQRLTAELGDGDRQQRVDHVLREIRSLLPARHQLVAVGVGATGPVDVATSEIDNDATLPWFSGIGLVRQIEQELRVAVTLDNDADAAAIGEYHALADPPHRLLLITLGTGVGGSLLIEGQPFRGTDARHPEVGHLLVFDGTDPPCYCGLRGCWEPRAARVALQAALVREVGSAVPAHDVLAEGARQHPRSAAVRDIFRRYGADVGQGLAALATAYLPDAILVGGSAGGYLPLFIEGIEQARTQQSTYTPRAPIAAASLGDLAGAIGAAAMAARAAD